MATSYDALVLSARNQATTVLQNLAKGGGLRSIFQTAFGNSFSEIAYQQLVSSWKVGNFSKLPKIEVLTHGELGLANGAYAAASNTIYLSGDFLARSGNNLAAVADVLIEEIGHSVDQLLNLGRDSAGDEGEIFRLLARGTVLSAGQLAALRGQNDHGVVTIGGRGVAIEQAAFFGTNNDDTLYGGAGDDILYGYTGNDDLYGNEGNDTLYGANGDDNLSGANGNDRLDGGAGNDTLYGANGDDDLYGGAGNNYLDGGDGNDFLTGFIGNDNLYGGAGDDYLTGYTGDDNLYGGDGNDTLYGIDGNDYLNGGTGNDTLNGGTGDDTLYGDAGDDSLSGEFGNDTVNGGSGNDTIYGGEDDDTLFGGTGNDSLLGDVGNDILYGDIGNDTLDGGDGENHLYGGSGSDLYYVRDGSDVVHETSVLASSIDTIIASISYTLGANLEKLTLFASVDALNGIGNDLNNIIAGNSYNNILGGAAGNDVLNGAAGADTMDGGVGNDIYYVDNIGDLVVESSAISTEIDIVGAYINNYTLTANVENLNLGGAVISGNGNGSNNVINGNASGNILNGGLGDDTLNGGVGLDQLTGGAGIDCFVLHKAQTADIITDFSTGDKLKVSAAEFLGGLTAGALAANRFLGGAGVLAATDANQRFIFETTSRNLYFDEDGNGIASIVQIATLQGVTPLTAANFTVGA
jgi:Ca2+-binding RTX toxin-like protein